MERIVRANISEAELSDDVDFDALWDVIEGFTPAYIHEVLNKAIIGAVVLSKGGTITVTTEDLLAAANVVKAQWKLQQEAVEPPKPPTLDQAFRAIQVDAARSVLHSDESQVLLLESASIGVRSNLDAIEGRTRSGIEDGLNAAALYDRNGDDKKGQIVVE
jgi:SpoVK/Ycf46/Vps4 family AAA+-type ATPase